MNDYEDLVRKMDDDALVSALVWHVDSYGYSRGYEKDEAQKADVCKAELRRRLAAKKEGKA